MIAYARFRFGGQDAAVELAFEAAEALNEPQFKPQLKSATTVDIMIREYATLNDLPEINQGTPVQPLDRAKMLICLLLGIGACSISGPFRKIVTKRYNMKPADVKLLGQWYHQQALLMAYKQGDINIWAIMHNYMHKAGWYQADQVRQCYRRVQSLITSKIVRPEIRVQCVMNCFYWYIPHAPEFIKSGIKQLIDILPLIKGNIKHAAIENEATQELIIALLCSGDFHSAKYYMDILSKIVDDTEALEGMKATNTVWKVFGRWWVGAHSNDEELCIEGMKELLKMDKKYPNAKKVVSSWIRRSTFYHDGLHKANFAIQKTDWDTVEACLHNLIPRLVQMLPPYRTHSVFQMGFFPSIIELYAYKKKMKKEDENLKNALRDARARVEEYAITLPGMYRCCGQAFVARISLLLEDRALKDELQRMEDALAYVIEVDCMPLDLLILKDYIGTWKCDMTMLLEAKKGYEAIQFKMLLPQLEKKIEDIKAGELLPVDLTFVPADGPDDVSSDNPLMVIEKAILEAKAKVKASKDDKDAWKAARAEVKRLTNEKKAMVAKIEAEANAIDIDAKINELQIKIDEANDRAMEAMDADDEEGEEAAYAEAEKLMDELEKLKSMMSGPKKNLVEAQQTDKALN